MSPGHTLARRVARGARPGRLARVRHADVGGLRYRAHEHTLHRGREDWFAYLILLVAYELPLLVLGTIGAVWSVRRRHALGTGLTVAAGADARDLPLRGRARRWLLVTTLIPLALVRAPRTAGGRDPEREWLYVRRAS